jgi:hypothetical protein
VYDARQGKPGSPEQAASGGGRPGGSLLPVLMVTGCLAMLGVIVASCAGTAGLLTLLAVGGMVGFVVLHYVLWGAWLAKRIRQSERDAGAADEVND